MRVLLDENVPKRLKFRLELNFEVSTVQEQGWTSSQNGALLAQAEGKFDVLVTFDSSLEYQQDLTGKKISILVIRTHSNAYKNLIPLVPSIVDVLSTVSEGKVFKVSG